MDRIMVTNMDADAQVPSLYVQEVDHAAAAAEDPHLLVGTHGILSMHLISEIKDHADHARVFPNLTCCTIQTAGLELACITNERE